MKIVVTSIMVDDQRKALKFYTEKLGFILKHDVPVGEYSWLTVVSPEAPDGVELLLEPMGFAPAREYQKQLFDAGIPATSFGVDDIRAWLRSVPLDQSARVEEVQRHLVFAAFSDGEIG